MTGRTPLNATSLVTTAPRCARARARAAYGVCAFSVLALMGAGEALVAQEAGGESSAWYASPSLTYSAVRDERVSPLRYSGLEWGVNLGYTSRLAGPGWHVEGEVYRGSLDHGGGSPTETSTSFALRGGFAWPLSSVSTLKMGVEGALTGGVRVQHYESVDAGYAEAFLGIGPTFEYTLPFARGDLTARLAGSVMTLMARPYADVGVARDGDLIVRMRLPPDLLVARAGLRYSLDRRGRVGWDVGYDLGAQRISDADHFGRLTHSLVVSAVWRRSS